MSNWQPSASISTLRDRAALLDAVRDFFRQRKVLEVETPLLSGYAITDPNLHSAVTRLTGLAGNFYLHTSPEFFMKRLLAAGSGDIWQACKVFRGAEQGRLHNPEFTLLEWYRIGFDHHRLMQEVAELLGILLPGIIAGNFEVYSYREAFIEFADIDPFEMSDSGLRSFAAQQGASATELDRDDCLDLIASHAVYPQLGHGKVSFITDFPASQAALARFNQDGQTARRFEAFVNGVELANGFHELGDAGEQRHRFESENARRREAGLPEMPLDEALLEALAAGFPDCSGVALGFDRIVMLATGKTDIAEATSFGFDRIQVKTCSK